MEGAARLHQFSDTAQTLPCLLLDTVQSIGESNAVGPHTFLRTEHQLLHWVHPHPRLFQMYVCRVPGERWIWLWPSGKEL